MIPILFNKDEKTFTSLGLGQMDATLVEVERERNGNYTLYAEVPFNSPQAKHLKKEMLIKADAGSRTKWQTFKINRTVKDTNADVIKVYADHISMDTINDAMKPKVVIRQQTAEGALRQWANNLVSGKAYDVQSDITHVGSTEWTIDEVENARQALGGVSGSILDVWGGEYEFDNNTIILHKEMGRTAPTVLEYGRNIVSLEYEELIDGVYTSIYPYATYTPKSEDNKQLPDIMVTLDELIIDSEYAGNYETRRIQIVDFSGEFDSNAENPEIPTQAKLRTLAKAYVKNNGYGIPKISQEIDFVDLSKTLDYQDIQVMEEIELNDRVPVYYPNIDAESNDVKVTTTNWDVLNNRYSKITLSTIGAMKSNSITSKLSTAIKDLKAEQKKINNTVPYLINGQGNRIWWTTPDDNMEHKIDDTWFKKNGKYTIILKWNGSMWEEVLNDETFITEIEAEVSNAIAEAENAKELAVSEAESALALAKADATAKDNAIKEQISSEVNTAITTAEDAKALAVTEAENALALAKADATAKANAVKEEVSTSVNTAIETAETAKQTAIDGYNNAVAEAERLVGEQTTTFDNKFGEIEDSVDTFNQSVSDADAKAEAIKQGLGLDDITLTNQQITDQIRADYNSVKQNANNALTNADTAVNDFNDFKVGYDDFIANQFNPALTAATSALSLAEQNEGLFYSANLIDEVTGLSNVYTKAEIDGTNGYVTKATFKANAESISSEFERIEGVALASGANINLLVRKDEQAGKYLDTGGVIKDNPDYAISTHKINVTSGEKLTFSQNFARNFRYAFYKSDGTFLSFGMSASQKFTITVPTNASYMLPSYSTSENYPKIERGEVKTQWTLAPQDQVNQSTVNYLTSKIEQTPGMITEALTAYTPTNSLDDTVSTYLTNESSATAGAINTKLTDYQTKDTLDGSVANLFTNTNSATAQKIDSSLTEIKGLIPTTIDNQNMLDGTSDVWLQGDVTNNWNMYAYSGPTAKISALPNSTYILSADVIKEYNDVGLFIFEYQNSTLIKENYVAGLWKYPTDKVRRSFKIKTGANTNNIAVGFRFNAGNIQTKFKYRRVQLEHSEIETDWKPSFKDTVALSDYTTFKNDTTDTATLHAKKLSSITAEGIVTSSSVNQTADGIAQRVAKVDEYGNVAYTNTDIKLDSIVSTVANGTYISNLIQTSNLLQSTITSFAPNQNILNGTDFTNEENTMGDVIEYGRKPRFSKADYFSYGRIATIDIPETSGDANLGFAVKLPTKDKWYTLSFYGLANWLGTAGVDFYVTDPYKTLKNYKATLLPEYDLATYRIQVTVKATVANSIIYVRPQGNRFNGKYNNIVFWGVKLEGGEVATKWGDNVSSSRITQLEDNINLKVSNKDLLSEINVQAEGVLIQSGTNKLNITPETTYIEDATIKSAMIDTVNVKQLTGITADFTAMVTKALTANTITSTMINANDAMFEKLFANSMATTKLAAQEAWIKDANIIALDAGTITTGTIDSGLIDAEYIVTNGLSTNVVESKHIQSSTALIDKIFADEALITHLTSNTIFASKIKAIEIDASKITSGELDAARIKSKDVVTAGLSANVVEATHIKAEAGLVDKLFSTTAYIEELTNKKTFTEKIQAINISADKITTGTLDAGKVKVINLDANNITANQADLVKAGFKGSSGGTLALSGDQFLSTASDGSQTYIQNGIVGARNPKGATIGQIGYVFDGGSPTYTIRTTWGSHFGLKQVFYDKFTKGAKEKRVMYASTADDGETTVQFYANSFILHQRKINFGFAHYINGSGSDLTITGQSSISFRANESTIFVLSNNGTNNFATLHSNLNMAGNKVTNTSDIRLKRDIVNNEIDSLSALMKWQHAGFNYINPDMNQERQFSVIAQSAPDISFTGEDGYLQVALNKQVNMTSHALQQHVIKTNDEISQLKAQVASLQDELALLKGD